MFFKKLDEKKRSVALPGKGRVRTSDLLRRRYKVGERVRGRVVRYIAGTRAWLDLDGQRVLAELEVVPPQGQEIEFLVLSVTPRIVLKSLGVARNKINILI